MSLGKLASHVADVTDWIRPIIKDEELDFSKTDYKMLEANSAEELTAAFDKSLADAFDVLKNASDENLMKNWKLRDGENIFFEMPRIQVLRGTVMNHLIHHRGQLSVYLRLKDVPLPSIYGPSADEQM